MEDDKQPEEPISLIAFPLFGILTSSLLIIEVSLGQEKLKDQEVGDRPYCLRNVFKVSIIIYEGREPHC